MLAEEYEMIQSEGPRRPKRGTEWCAHQWQRLVMMLMRMLAASRAQLVVNHHLQEDLPHSASASSEQPAPQKQYTRRRQLSRSKAKKTWDLEPMACPHSEEDLYMRGNQTSFWWTCQKKCGSRWTRCKPLVTQPTYPLRPELGTLPLDAARNQVGQASELAPETAVDPDQYLTDQEYYQKYYDGGLHVYEDDNGDLMLGTNMFGNQPAGTYRNLRNTEDLLRNAEAGRQTGGYNSRPMDSRSIVPLPGSQVRTIDDRRVDTRRLRPPSHQEFADYYQPAPRSSSGRRTRGLPAGVHPVRSQSRPRQTTFSQEPPETFAINSEGEEKDKTKRHKPYS
eukprot:s243_g7.t1